MSYKQKMPLQQQKKEKIEISKKKPREKERNFFSNYEAIRDN